MELERKVPGLSFDETYHLGIAYLVEIRKMLEEAQKRVEERLKIDPAVYQATMTKYHKNTFGEIISMIAERIR